MLALISLLPVRSFTRPCTVALVPVPTSSPSLLPKGEKEIDGGEEMVTGCFRVVIIRPGPSRLLGSRIAHGLHAGPPLRGIIASFVQVREGVPVVVLTLLKGGPPC